MATMNKKFIVEFDGRYKVDSIHRTVSDAEILAARIMDRHTFIKCKLTLNTYEFYVGRKKALYQISKKVFYFKDIDKIYNFSIYPSTIIILHKYKSASWFSFINFLSDFEKEYFTGAIVRQLNVSIEDIYRTDYLDEEYCSVGHSIIYPPKEDDLTKVIEDDTDGSCQTEEVIVVDSRERFVTSVQSMDKIFERSTSESLSLETVSSNSDDDPELIEDNDADILIINDSIYMTCKTRQTYYRVVDSCKEDND